MNKEKTYIEIDDDDGVYSMDKTPADRLITLVLIVLSAGVSVVAIYYMFATLFELLA